MSIKKHSTKLMVAIVLCNSFYVSLSNPNPTPGPAGIITVTGYPFTNGQANNVLLDASGNILVCGYGVISGQTYGIIARFKSDGRLDTTFNASFVSPGAPGYVMTSTFNANYVKMVFDPNNAGNFTAISQQFHPLPNPPNKGVYVAQYNPQGQRVGEYSNAGNLYGATSIAYVPGATPDSNPYYITNLIFVTSNGTLAPGLRYLRTTLTGNNNNYAYGNAYTLGSTSQNLAKGDITFPPNNSPRGTFVWTFTTASVYLTTNNNFSQATQSTISTANFTGGTSLASVGIGSTANIVYSSCCWNGVAGVTSFASTNTFFSLLTTFTAVTNSLTPNTANWPYCCGGGVIITDNISTTSIVNSGCNGNKQPYVARFLSNGNLDNSFNASGSTPGVNLLTASNLVPGMFQAVIQQPDRKTVAVGFTQSSAGSGWVLARYNTNGTLDTSFGSLIGVIQDTASPFSASSNGFIYTTTIDQNGKIVAGGQYNNSAFALRYTTTGGRDQGFNFNGVNALSALLATSTIQKIINNGTGYLATGVSNMSQLTTIALTSTGTAVAAFGSNGVVIETTVGASSGYDLLLNGTALAVAGYTSDNVPSVINYNSATGARDTSYKGGGLQTFASFGTGSLYGITTSKTQPTYRYAAGQGDNAAFLRLLINQTGILQDTASPFNATTNGFIYTTTIDQSGNIVVGGQYNSGALSIRYTTSAGRDGNFGADGVADLSSLATTATLQKIINYDGSYIAVGISNDTDFTTLQLTTTGSLDTTFGSGGAVVETGVGVSAAYDILITQTGTYPVLSVAGVTYANKPSIINYGLTGIRNNLLGNNGLQLFTTYAPGTLYGLSFNSTSNLCYGAGQSNNKAFLAGLYDQTGLLQDTAYPFNSGHNALIYSVTVAQDSTLLAVAHYKTDWYLIDYLATGTRNNSFGTNGIGDVIAYARPRSITTDSNGNIFVTGASLVMANETWTVAKYDPTGTLGPLIRETAYGVGNGLGIAINPDNTLVVVGYTTTTTNCPTVINYDNNLNQTNVRQYDELSPGYFFGYAKIDAQEFVVGASKDTAILYSLVDGTGMLQDTAAPFNTDQQAQIYAALIDNAGDIVLCGEYNNIFTLIRYTNIGERDTTFGPNANGVVQYNILTPSVGYNLLQDAQGNYYVTGQITVNSTPILAVFKYDNNGLLVSNFGTDGVVQGVTLGQSVGYGIARNSVDGTLLVVGQVTVNGQQVPAFIQYNASGGLMYQFGTQGVQTFNQYGAGYLRNTLVNQQLAATGVGSINNRDSNDSIATILQIGQGSNVIEQILTGF